jgi:uncharacterized protein (TIGR03643 family)
VRTRSVLGKEHINVNKLTTLIGLYFMYPRIMMTFFMINIRSCFMSFYMDEESRIIEMAWEDRTPFEAIEHQFKLKETEVIKFMRSRLKAKSFKLWRERVSGRTTKHVKLRSPDISRGYCPTQYKHR